MDHTEKRKPSFCDLPQEILELIAVDLSLLDYFNFRAVCRRIWSLFDCSAPSSVLQKIRMKGIQTTENDASEMEDKDCQFGRCHYISRAHLLSGHVLERAARSKSYELLTSWLIDHGASFREVPGGIDRLCCEAFEQGDYERFRWLFSKGACLNSLAGMVFRFPGYDGPRTREARRYYLRPLARALKEGARPSRDHEALKRELLFRRRQLRLRQHKELFDGRRESIG